MITELGTKGAIILGSFSLILGVKNYLAHQESEKQARFLGDKRSHQDRFTTAST